MRLGLKMDEVRLEEFTPVWIEEFTCAKTEILKHVQIEEHRIQHIGSTAITGMPAKPIIDILIGIDDLSKVDKDFIKKLNQAGFLRLKVERPGEIVFARFTDDTFQEKSHFIHLVEFEKELWKNLIFFRDYLNANEAARTEYTELKLDYLKKSSTGINEYTEHKEAFVRNIFNKRS